MWHGRGATSNPTVPACLAARARRRRRLGGERRLLGALERPLAHQARARVLASQAHAAFAAASHSPASALVAAARCAKSSC